MVTYAFSTASYHEGLSPARSVVKRNDSEASEEIVSDIRAVLSPRRFPPSLGGELCLRGLGRMEGQWIEISLQGLDDDLVESSPCGARR